MKTTANILEIATRRLSAQQFVPRSPGELDESGKPLLCLGAALAVAAVEARDGVQSAERCACHLATKGKKKDIVALGARYAISRRFLRRAIIKNDALADACRHAAIMAELTAR